MEEGHGSSGRGEGPTGPRRQLSRRTFVGIGVAALSAAALGSATVLPGRWRERIAGNLAWARGAHLSTEERIQQEFGYLQLDPEGVRAFVRDYTAHRGEIRRFTRPKDDIFERYLLSTDFFRNGADESRPVRYVLYYDPYVSPCWNPCSPVG